jgi:hypothetical protein
MSSVDKLILNVLHFDLLFMWTEKLVCHRKKYHVLKVSQNKMLKKQFNLRKRNAKRFGKITQFVSFTKYYNGQIND